MDFKTGFYQNKKNGGIYYAEKILTNCTNLQEGQIMVEYYKKGNFGVDFSNGYVREINEFMEKFEPINID